MKKNVKIILLVLCIPVCAIVLPIIYVSLPWAFLYIGGILTPNPPEPVITYGEFPFKLEYKVDGEAFIIEDVVICEYNGISPWNEGTGRTRMWKTGLKSNHSLQFVIFENDNTEINFFVGTATYYMSDSHGISIQPQLTVIVDNKAVVDSRKQEILDKCNVEIVNLKLSEPIENSFKDSMGIITGCQD